MTKIEVSGFTMSYGADATDFEAMLEAQSTPWTGSSTEVGFDSDVEVAVTIHGKWILTRDREVQEFENGEDLVRFLWAECWERKDSLVLLYQLGKLRPCVGPMVTCRVTPPDRWPQPA
jgi:hypothetical protein